MKINNIYHDKRILVTGGTGMIGRQLVSMLLEYGAKVRVASLDDPSRAPQGTEFVRADLTDYRSCEEICTGMDYVFQLAGIKGSPLVCKTKPASFFEPTILFSLNMLKAARNCHVQRFLVTSSVGVYAPAEVFHEDDVWKTFPSQNDWFAGWAKRMTELQVEANRIEYGWEDICIVRPANVYGPYDNFDPANAMVIPSLIRRAVDGERPLTVWGDGTPIRDFIHAKDVALGMLLAMDKMPEQPINLGSGTGVSIKSIVESICRNLGGDIPVVWDTSKPSGDKRRLLDISRAEGIGFEPTISLDQGIADTIEWYRANKSIVENRYNVFTQTNG